MFNITFFVVATIEIYECCNCIKCSSWQLEFQVHLVFRVIVRFGVPKKDRTNTQRKKFGVSACAAMSSA